MPSNRVHRKKRTRLMSEWDKCPATGIIKKDEAKIEDEEEDDDFVNPGDELCKWLRRVKRKVRNRRFSNFGVENGEVASLDADAGLLNVEGLTAGCITTATDNGNAFEENGNIEADVFLEDKVLTVEVPIFSDAEAVCRFKDVENVNNLRLSDAEEETQTQYGQVSLDNSKELNEVDMGDHLESKMEILISDTKKQRSLVPECKPSEAALNEIHDDTACVDDHEDMHETACPDATSSSSERDLESDHGIKPALINGPKCGLCGGGSDGLPPKELIRKPSSIKNVSKSNDGSDGLNFNGNFSKEKGWLGRLLGPLSDSIGAAGVWIHLECAIWSPEVYFSGLGHLKNVRAALRRGRCLKCSRCGLPGATIGCRVERCPQNYHLPCGRFEGCSFDHKKFLMACKDHLRWFKPRKQKAYGIMSNNAFKPAVEIPQTRYSRLGSFDRKANVISPFNEYAGEDEEFVKREKKRLQRDLACVAPKSLGGPGQSDDKFLEGWEAVAGLQEVVQCLKEMVTLPLMYPQIFQKLGITPPRGVLLHGHPGTGKTLVVRALLGACSQGSQRISYFARKGADCLGKYVGDSERQLRLLFNVAEECQPSIIFFDEIDGLAPKRSKHQDQTQSTVVSTLLALMDGLKSRGSVIVIGATNRPDALDPALRRPGRFDREIYFPLPSVKDREAILTLHTRKWSRPPSSDVLSTISKLTNGYAGADLQALCTQAALIALKRVMPLEKLFGSAERPESSTLPEMHVKPIDWATALADAPLPCSRRTASTALSDISAFPLPRHTVPCLLKPLTEILIALNSDGRFCLPPSLRKAAEGIKHFISGYSLGSVILDGNKMRRIEDFLVGVGLISNVHIKGCTTDQEQKSNIMDPMPSFLSAEHPICAVEEEILVRRELSGSFRILLAGGPKNGQSLLASTLLYGFEGSVQTCVLSLHTMIQGGYGDVMQGLLNALEEARNAAPCIIYIPQLECWAVEKLFEEELDASEGTKRANGCSRIWDLFIQQLKITPPGLHMMFLATSDTTKNDLPNEVLRFFGSNNENNSASEQPAACACLELPAAPTIMAVFDRAIEDVVDILIFSFHHVTCKSSMNDSRTESAVEDSHTKEVNAKGETSITMDASEGSCKQAADTEKPFDLMRDNFICLSKVSSKEQRFLQNEVFSCGYQLLYCPQLSAIRQATLKFREGPSVTKEFGGGFAACAKDCLPNTILPCSSQTDEAKEEENIFGLAAVALKACRGFYRSASELACDVRWVIEVLNEKITNRLRNGRDSIHCFYLSSQGAALLDLVLCWAHQLQSFENAACQRLELSTHENDKQEDDNVHLKNHNDTPLTGAETIIGTQLPVINNNDATISALAAEAKTNASLANGMEGSLTGAETVIAKQSAFDGTMPALAADAKTNASLANGRPESMGGQTSLPGVDTVIGLPVIDHNDAAMPAVAADHEINASLANGRPESMGGQTLKLQALEIELKAKQHQCSHVCQRRTAIETRCKCLKQLKAAVKDLLLDLWRTDGAGHNIETVSDMIGECAAAVTAAIRKRYGKLETPLEPHNIPRHFAGILTGEQGNGVGNGNVHEGSAYGPEGVNLQMRTLQPSLRTHTNGCSNKMGQSFLDSGKNAIGAPCAENGQSTCSLQCMRPLLEVIGSIRRHFRLDACALSSDAI